MTYTLGYTSTKWLGTAQFYLRANKDKDGQDFDSRWDMRWSRGSTIP
ncbi:hypothetical protein NLM33_41035 [Bradyrhizobium sp. CCGUVB1N3]|nr:hypothetical protein [Bradyrhizobium sp. CCGUVB1N3]MCP3476582.1 hypothetical protein [Bradyrhizobium sp. CCGUVB1N3]